MPTSTALMDLKIPNPGENDYSTSVSDSFNNIDAHDHSAGNGTPVVTDGIADSAVTTAKINALAVTTAKIAAANVTRAKLEAVGHQTATLGSNFSTTSTTYSDVGLSVTITTTGRPVMIVLHPGATALKFGISSSGSNPVIQVLRDATQIMEVYLATNVQLFPVNFVIPDAPSAGTYIYKVQAKLAIATGTLTIDSGPILFAYEL